MIKFGIKVGLTAGAAYYISEQGVWKNSDTTTTLYNKISTNISPYTSELKKQIPIEFPSLPKTNEVSFVAIHYWNKGVLSTFGFLSNIPSYVGEWTGKGIDAILDTTEVKNLFVASADTAGRQT